MQGEILNYVSITKMMEQVCFFSVSHFLLSVSSASCSLRAFELSAVISPGTTGKTLLHCVSLIEAAVPKNNRTRIESKLMNSWSWKGIDKKMSLHLKVSSVAPF